MRYVLPLLLVTAACVETPPTQATDFDYTILRCNHQVDGGRFLSALDVRFADASFRHFVGEDGLTRQMAQDGAAAVAFVEAQHPERAVGLRAFYNDNCGRRRESVTDDGD
ncbi:MAG: hypothetical protein AAF264_00360 [Pseudomonadota bacterium]